MEANAPTSPSPTSSAGSPEAPELVRRAAGGEKLDGAEERSALDWLLGATIALEYDVDVKYDTPQGIKPLTFRIRQQDPSVLDEADARHRSGEGPFAKLDVNAFNADLASVATVWIQDASGRQVDPKSEEFRGGVPSPALAMGIRFKYQPGLLEGIAEQIRQISAFGPDRVGTAHRVLVEAGKASSNGAG